MEIMIYPLIFVCYNVMYGPLRPFGIQRSGMERKMT